MKVSGGFSLVELMVVITIVAVLLALGVPSYRYVTNSNRVSSEVNALLGDLQFARSEAIKEGATVTVCPTANFDFAAAPICNAGAGSTEWDKGWIVTSPTVTPNVLRVQVAFREHEQTVSCPTVIRHRSPLTATALPTRPRL